MTALVLYSESLDALALLEWDGLAWSMHTRIDSDETLAAVARWPHAYDWTLVGEL